MNALRSVCPDAAVTLGTLSSTLFRRLLDAHAVHLVAAGLAVDDLAARGPDALWADEHRLPVELVDTLHRIDEMTDEVGHDLLVDLLGGPLFAADGWGASPVELAASSWLDRRDTFLRAHGRRFVHGTRRMRELRGRDATPARTPTLEIIAALEERFGLAFERRGRSRHCRIRWFEEGGDWHFVVAHGRPPRLDTAIEERPGAYAEARLVWRPRQHDVVVFDRRLGNLRVCAPDAGTLRLYVEGFGDALFGDAGWFAPASLVTLDPLVLDGPTALRPIRGLRTVQLVELVMATDPDGLSTAAFRGEDVFRVLDELRIDPPGRDRLRSAKLRLHYAGESRARMVSLIVPDRVSADWRKEPQLTREFLEARGFLSTSADAAAR